MSMEDILPNLAPDSLPITCLVWNVQGAGNRNFLSILKDLIRENKPNVFVLVETHMGGAQAEKIASMVGYSGHSRVDAVGFSGGIWYFTAVYASPDLSQRQELWQELKNFATTHNKPWLIAGDFNDTRFPSERNSSCRETTRRSRLFNDWVEEMDLIEVEFMGATHTWSRGNSEETRRSGRLDRALCTDNWALRFDKAKVKHLPAIHSDHCPIFISPNGFVPLQALHRPFRFQATWLTHENFKEFVSQKWDSNGTLMSSLSKLSTDLQCWNRDVFGNVFKQKRNLMARIAGVQRKLAEKSIEVSLN
ncbi:uncharacterized protein LOC110722174 [Chenopodium quinoa]|uniref:uncharacterized protein LOC110722174 n=1 Tax=Chenopodium quinoa TaxID=63459 RepID=UPI000B78D6DF|nr:uncharacterized protein LOC110722174 [Chenopodium quinoa]